MAPLGGDASQLPDPLALLAGLSLGAAVAISLLAVGIVLVGVSKLTKTPLQESAEAVSCVLDSLRGRRQGLPERDG